MSEGSMMISSLLSSSNRSREQRSELKRMDMIRTGSFTEAKLKKDDAGSDQGIIHFSHPQHPLLPVTLHYLFTCAGCKEYGAGKRFRCQPCGFDLHDFCALAPPSLDHHPFHPKHAQLLFFVRPAGGFLRSRCDVCGKAAKGYTYRCSTCSFEMHPCCAAMSREMKFPTHQHPLKLLPNSSSEDHLVCSLCQRKRNGVQVYHCETCRRGCYQLHAVCAKDMVNGLYVHGIRSPEKSNKFGTAARLATRAFLGIIGDLIEGIGEGVGEALIGGIARSAGKTRAIKRH